MSDMSVHVQPQAVVPHAEIAQRLLEAELKLQPMAQLTERWPRLEVSDAYAIQRFVIEAKRQAGAKRVGAKVGLTSRAMQEMLGVSEPDYGVLLDRMRVQAQCTLKNLIAPRVEPEIAFTLKRDLRGPGIDRYDVLRAVESVCPALEIIDSRIRDWRIRLADTIADNASSARFALGREQPIGKHMGSLASVEGRMMKNGAVVATGRGDAVLGHPADPVAWLANRLAEHGEWLRAGDIVLPGAITSAITVVAGDVVRADFDGLGDVELEFTR